MKKNENNDTINLYFLEIDRLKKSGVFDMGMKERVKKSLTVLAVGVLINAVLAIIKMYVGLSANSLCIMVDATNSLFDIVTGVVTILAFLCLLYLKSENAPFGYGRVEYLAGFIASAVAVVVGGVFMYRSITRLALPEPVWFGLENCILVSVAVPIKLGLALIYYFANKKLKSKAIRALVADSFLDTGITATSLVSFAVSSQVEYAVDAILGMVISVIVIVCAIKMVVDSIKTIVIGDKAETENECVKAVVAGCNDIKQVVKTIFHDYGFGTKVGDVKVEFELGVDDEKKSQVKREISSEVYSLCGARVRVVEGEDFVFESVSSIDENQQDGQDAESEVPKHSIDEN